MSLFQTLGLSISFSVLRCHEPQELALCSIDSFKINPLMILSCIWSFLYPVLAIFLALARIWISMGDVYYQQSKHDEASKEYRKALWAYIACLGKNHPEVARTRRSMGGVYYQQSKYDEAVKEYSEALWIFIAHLGENHLEVARTRTKLAHAYEEQSKHDEALAEYSKALEIYEIYTDCLSETDVEVVCFIHHCMGLLYEGQLKYDEALEKFGKGLRIYIDCLGENDPEVVWTRIHMSELYRQQRKYDAALAECMKALEIDTSLGLNNIRCAVVRYELGNVFIGLSRYDSALAEFYKGLDIYSAILGENHPRVVEMRQGIVLVKAEAVAAQRRSRPVRSIETTLVVEDEGAEPQIKRPRLVELNEFQ